MRSLLVLISCFVFSSADPSNSSVNWSVDDDTLPESLPELMYYNYVSDKDIEKAVFWAYKIQYDVISEHNGHVYDEISPLGYFDDGLILPMTRASSINSDVVFENNTVDGLTNYKSNKVTIKWAQDRVTTEVTWKELRIVGNYEFSDGWNYEIGKYQIFVDNVTYQADTPLSKNAELYPLSAPNSAISYSNFRTTFTGDDRSITNELLAIRYFLEKVAVRHVADYAMAATRKNVTSAIRAAVRPYVMFKNHSDSHFPGATGRLDDGRTFVVSDPNMNGLNNAVQKVRSVRSEPNAGGEVIVYSENTLHKLDGTFNLLVREAAGDDVDISVDYTVDRMSMSVVYDALKPNCYCSTVVRVYGATARTTTGHGQGTDGFYLQQVMTAFTDAVKDHLSNGTCQAIVKANRYGGRNHSCPAASLLYEIRTDSVRIWKS